MLRRVSALGVVRASALGVLCLVSNAQAQAPIAPVPTAKKVVTTPEAPPKAAPVVGKPAPAPPAAAAPKPPNTPPAPPPAAESTAAPGTVERARQGIVTLERQGRPLSLGAVLDGDGRVLTALSPLGNGNFLSARYADGSVVPIKLVHSDRGWDLALLSPAPAPNQAPRKAGVKAARTPSFTGLQTFTAGPKGPVTAPATLKLSPNLLGGDAVTLSGAYEIAGAPALAGAPVVNPEGEVVALIARACPGDAKPGCTPAPYAAPVSALKRFLQRVPAQAAWLGIDGASDERGNVRGVRVVSVAPASPAAKGGLRPGGPLEADLIVAVDGAPVTTPQDLNDAVRAHTTGEDVELLLFGLGRYRHVSIKPSAAPELAQPPYVAPPPAPPKSSTPNPYR
jgi:serine protease Do